MGRLGGGLWSSTRQWSAQNEDEPHASLLAALNTPWQPFELSLSLSTSLSVPKSPKGGAHAQLQADLHDLASGTTPFGRPQRVWPARPRFGVIAEHLEKMGAEVGWPPHLRAVPRPFLREDQGMAYGNLGSYAFGESATACDENKAPPQLGAAVAPAFEVRAYAATLPEVIATPLTAAIDVDFDHDSGFFECEAECEGEGDENKAPVRVDFLLPTGYTAKKDAGKGQNREVDDDENRNEENENQEKPLEIPEPHMRGARKPLGVLHFDQLASPPSVVHAVAEAEKPLSVSVSVSPPGSETGEEVPAAGEGAVGGLKGWARLRPIAPPAIKTSGLHLLVVDMEKEKDAGASAVPKGGLGGGNGDVRGGTGAPLMLTVPLPPVDSGTPVSEKDKQKPGLPDTPRRAALLMILNAQ
ncbi:hypothetical protein LshimejAT787_0410340 [Lyophyllum shimeji]|uniref:Uncharacterized protein n=1 Tax=Lyophyllum shimeji TaxID=47721 RepID=A0A9P3PM59_LYOSH|nr:hypothetical protein LshimejAT787_0410340 [Lyophyllum shimeji]